MEQDLNREKRVTSVNLPVDLIEFVKGEAEASHRNLSSQIAFFLEQAKLRHNQISLNIEESV